jgi:hypothetical protein
MYRGPGTSHLLPDLFFLVVWCISILEVLNHGEDLLISTPSGISEDAD